MYQYDLECVDVAKKFGTFEAVKKVSFNVEAGSFFSILGPSGCGKTTLLRMIAGFETPTTGDILVKGKSILSRPPNKRNISMVFQNLALFPMMNVEENIAYGLKMKGVSQADIKHKVTDILKRVSLPDAGKKEVHQLSGGQKQRIAIARCMVLEPDLLLLDEPLGALDLKLREHMKVELKQLQKEFGTTFVFITHDQSEALVMSDYVAVMNKGAFEQIAPPTELYHHPKTPFIAGFIGESNRWSGVVKAKTTDYYEIETSVGLPMKAVSSIGQLAVGDRTHIFVRPEAIVISRQIQNSISTENHIKGKVINILFNGSNSQVQIKTDTGETITSDLPQIESWANLREGEELFMTWTASQTKAFIEAE